MSLDETKVIPLGPCSVSFAGSDLGHTDENGVMATIKTTWVEAKVGKYGKGSVVELFRNGQEIEISGVLQQSDMATLVQFLPGATVVTDGSGNKKLTFGTIAGTKNTSGALVLTPYVSGVAPDFNLSLVKATPVGDFDIVYTGDKVTGYKFMFRGLINELSGSDGSYLFTFGDSSITADVTVPAVTAFSPLDGAAGVATSAIPTATFDNELDPTTVSTDSVHLVEDPLGTAVDVPGTVTLVNAGAATQVIFTPTSALTGGKTYLFFLEDSIKGMNGIAIVFSKADWAT